MHDNLVRLDTWVMQCVDGSYMKLKCVAEAETRKQAGGGVRALLRGQAALPNTTKSGFKEQIESRTHAECSVDT